MKVVRYQTVVDATASNHSRFTSSRVDDLGMGKSFSHANSKFLSFFTYIYIYNMSSSTQASLRN